MRSGQAVYKVGNCLSIYRVSQTAAHASEIRTQSL